MSGCLVVNSIIEAPVGQEVDKGLSICQRAALVSDTSPIVAFGFCNIISLNLLFEELRSELVDSET